VTAENPDPAAALASLLDVPVSDLLADFEDVDPASAGSKEDR